MLNNRKQEQQKAVPVRLALLNLPVAPVIKKLNTHTTSSGFLWLPRDFPCFRACANINSGHLESPLGKSKIGLLICPKLLVSYGIKFT